MEIRQDQNRNEINDKNAMDLIIRIMTEDDLDEVYAIEQVTFTDPWTRQNFQDSLDNKDYKFIIAEVGGRVAGYCGYWGVMPEGYIYNVAVKKDYRRKKIGYRMLKKLMEWATAEGITAFTLEVRSSNEAAIRLYKQLGFEAAGVRKDFYTKPREDAIIMWTKPIQ